MCVIVYKPKNIAISLKTINLMWDSNPDGAGIAVVDAKDGTHVYKGYRDAESLHADVRTLQAHNVVLHFRWATHGLINTENCHPFVLSKDIAESNMEAFTTNKPVLFHNGVISGYGDELISDTADFTTSVLSRLTDTKEVIRLLQTTYSKYILVHKNKVQFVGKFEKYKGLQVSNLDFAWEQQRYVLKNDDYRKDCPNIDEQEWLDIIADCNVPKSKKVII